MTETGYTTLYIVRHGETDGNIQHIVQGHDDSGLTEEGKKQVQNTAKN